MQDLTTTVPAGTAAKRLSPTSFMLEYRPDTCGLSLSEAVAPKPQHVTPTKSHHRSTGHPLTTVPSFDENERGTPARQAKSQTSSHGGKQHHRMDGHDLESGYRLH